MPTAHALLAALLLPLAAAVPAGQPAAAAAAGVEREFTSRIEAVKASLDDITARVAAVEEAQAHGGARGGAAAAPGTLKTLLPDALADLAAAMQKLRGVRDDVGTTSSLSAPVKVQVLWNLDRMVLDVGRLHSSSLVPLGRAALVQALHLRFGVLLTPAFWSAPIKRSLMADAM